MKVLDVCSGIGGFSLAAAWCGWQTIGFCEIDPWCRKVLAKHWPEVPQHDDIWTLDADLVRRWLADAWTSADAASATCEARQSVAGADGPAQLARRGGLDLLCGGIPCQPFSVAGKQRGQDDPRHLWPAVARLVADLRPRWLCIENVSGFVRLALDDLLADLDRLGYAAWPLVVPAAGVGALHRRDRVWVIAGDLADAGRAERRPAIEGGNESNRDDAGRQEAPSGESSRGREISRHDGRLVADAAQLFGLAVERWQSDGIDPIGATINGNAERQTQPGFCLPSDGLSRRMAGFVSDHWQGDPMQAFGHDHEYGVPLVVSGSVKDRVNKLKALGNAIVPQVAYQIFLAIQEAEA